MLASQAYFMAASQVAQQRRRHQDHPQGLEDPEDASESSGISSAGDTFRSRVSTNPTEKMEHSTLHGFFAKFLAASSPELLETPAVISADVEMTFSALDMWSDYVMAMLNARNRVENSRPIAVALEPSMESVIFIFGILKLGAPYLPLNPHWNAQKLKRHVEDAKARALICSDARTYAGTFEKLEVMDARRFLAVAAEVFGTQKCISVSTCKPNNPAIILVNDDSGQLTIVSHTLIYNQIRCHWNKLPFARGEIVPHWSPLYSTNSFVELFGSLLAGHSIFILSKKTPPLMIDSLLKLPEISARRALVSAEEFKVMMKFFKTTQRTYGGRLKALVVSCGRRPYPVDLALQFFDSFPGAKLISTYSVSALAGDVTWCVLDSQKDLIDNLHGELVPSGFAIDNMHISIENEYGTTVADGTVGEICVAGPLITLETTLLKDYSFICKDQSPHSVLLRTGDIGFLQPETNILFVSQFSGRKSDVEVMTSEDFGEVTKVDADVQADFADDFSLSYIKDFLDSSSDGSSEPATSKKEFKVAEIDQSTRPDVHRIITSNTFFSTELEEVRAAGIEQLSEELRTYIDDLIANLEPKAVNFVMRDDQNNVCAVNLAYDAAAVSPAVRDMLESVASEKSRLVMWVTHPIVASLPKEKGLVLESHMMNCEPGTSVEDQFELFCRMDEELEWRARQLGYQYICTKNFDPLMMKVSKSRGYSRWASFQLNQLALPLSGERPFNSCPDGDRLTVDIKAIKPLNTEGPEGM